MEGFVKYCPRCSQLFYGEKSKLGTCDFCATKLIESDLSNEAHHKMPITEILAWKKEVVESNPLYSAATHERMKEDALNKARAENEAKMPKCPYCGHTKFQMVPKRWSLLTGFLTNKVDRVCENCKKRF